MVFMLLKESKKHVDFETHLISSGIISASHQRCRKIKLDPGLTRIPGLLNHTDIINFQESSGQLLSVAWPIIKNDLYSNFVDEDQLIILCNHEGYIINLLSSPRALELCYSMNIAQGTCLREEICGTSAISMAMQQKRMVIVRGEQHYCQIFKDWISVATPIRSWNGEIIGFLNVSMDSDQEWTHTLALVQLAVKYIEKMYAEKLAPVNLHLPVVSPELVERFENLSRREKEVFRSMAEGLTVNSIGETKGMSTNTVRTYQKRICRKLGAGSNIECLIMARKLGLFIK